MINLAGIKNADEIIEEELERAGITTISHTRLNTGEVKYSVTGSLFSGNGECFDIKFHRAWSYWVVKGPVPLEVAQQLYQHPEGRISVRVAGHCGCPPPEDWVEWLNYRGEKPNKDEYQPYIPSRPYITTYHIDTQAGLLLFVETIKKWIYK